MTLRNKYLIDQAVIGIIFASDSWNRLTAVVFVSDDFLPLVGPIALIYNVGYICIGILLERAEGKGLKDERVHGLRQLRRLHEQLGLKINCAYQGLQ